MSKSSRCWRRGRPPKRSDCVLNRSTKQAVRSSGAGGTAISKTNPRGAIGSADTRQPNQRRIGPVKPRVSDAFAARQKLHQAEVGQLRQRLRAIEQTLKTGQRLSKEIIDKRVKDLLNPDLQWEGGPRLTEATAAKSKPQPLSSDERRLKKGMNWREYRTRACTGKLDQPTIEQDRVGRFGCERAIGLSTYATPQIYLTVSLLKR